MEGPTKAIAKKLAFWERAELRGQIEINRKKLSDRETLIGQLKKRFSQSAEKICLLEIELAELGDKAGHQGPS